MICVYGPRLPRGMTGAFSSMRDPAIDALATDPAARVMVFVDGQNLYNRCRDLFGHPLCHPHLLAQYLAGPRTHHPAAATTQADLTRTCRVRRGNTGTSIVGSTSCAKPA